MNNRTKKSTVPRDPVGEALAAEVVAGATEAPEKKGRAHRMTDRKQTVADFMKHKIAMSAKSQRKIAEEAGYPNPNVVTMLKQGAIKVPMGRLVALSKTLDIDPKYLLRLCMEEYMPDTWAVFHEVFGMGPTICDEEMEVIGVMREAQEGYIPSMDAPANRKAVIALIKKLAAADWAANEEFANKQNKLPSNKRGK